VANLRILLGDDHTLFRHGLLKILEERPDWAVVAEAGDGRECVRQAVALQPDVAVLDIGMPLLNGIEATRQIVRRMANAGVTDRYQTLSEREREIFQLVAEGHTNKSIAEMLSVSPTTVETHRAHILQKLDIHNTAELVLYAVRRGVIS
jgi:DNA-binding NarL/FixJ family response regulator